MRNPTWLLLPLLIFLTAWAFPCFAADSDTHSTAAATADDHPVDYEPKALDGVTIEAVESYPSPKKHELGFGLGVYPFNPYYTAFSFNADYVWYMSRTWAWEIVNASAAFTVDSGLQSQLAQKWNVSPNQIERLNALFSTNIMYVHSHGKLLFLDHYIRYFRSYVIGGLGYVTTNMNGEMGVNVGLRVDAQISDSFSWKFEVRDMIAITGEQFAMFNLGTGLSF